MTFLVKVAGRRGFAFAFVAQCFLVGSAAAQISGVVTRAGGIPLDGVSVEAWSVDRRVGATITDAQGVYSAGIIGSPPPTCTESPRPSLRGESKTAGGSTRKIIPGTEGEFSSALIIQSRRGPKREA